MAGTDDLSKTVNRYLELVANGTADELTALYTENATIEDPIGSAVRRGHAAIHEFYAAIENIDKETELVSLRVADREAAYLWRLTMKSGDSRTRLEPISVMTFDENAKITSMRAFWSPTDLSTV